MKTTDPRSIPELISTLTTDLGNLVRKESELVRTEVAENIHNAARAGQAIGLGAALLLGGFLTLLAALVLGLSKVMDPTWAALVVGVVVSLIGFTLVKRATRKIAPTELAPNRATRQLQKDAKFVKEQVQ